MNIVKYIGHLIGEMICSLGCIAYEVGRFAVIGIALVCVAAYSIDYYQSKLPAAVYKGSSILREDPTITFQKIKTVYNDSAFDSVRLIIVGTDGINAFTDMKHVYVTKGLLDVVASTDELALVLGHELGHIKDYNALSDVERAKWFLGDYKQSQAHERVADEYGLLYANKAGYKGCAGAEFFFKLLNRYGEIPYNSTHPTNASRLSRLACQPVEVSVPKSERK